MVRWTRLRAGGWLLILGLMGGAGWSVAEPAPSSPSPAADAPAAGPARIVFQFEGTPDADGLPPPWSFKRWSPLTRLGTWEATARVEVRDGRKVLALRSANSGFLVGTQRTVDVNRYPHVTWSWRAERLPEGGSFRQRSTNDQALQLLFGFQGGRVLGYLWDTTGPVGASGSGLAWREDVRVIVVRAGTAQLGQWLTEQRDLVADYRQLFGAAPPPLEGVAIQSNSQHTGSVGEGQVGAIVLTGAKP